MHLDQLPTAPPMDEDKRQRYLAAMGIPLWLSKNTQTQDQNVTDTAPEDVVEQPSMAIANMDWETLTAQVAQCQACPELVANRSRTVFGVGDRRARLLIIGEAPGADEDRQGEPFVGRAGQLLTSMLSAIGIQRDQVYIANILKCRPPKNRDPRPAEALQCESWLLRQIELVAPELILAVGRIAAQHLLKTQITVGKLRGQVHQYGDRRIPLVVTYHPSYLLRSPGQKVHAWKDLQDVITLLNQNSVTTAQ